MPHRYTSLNFVIDHPEGDLVLCRAARHETPSIHTRFADAVGPVVSRTADGRDMEHEHAVMQTLDRVLGLPDYFGFNWDALDECLCDREFEPRTRTVLVVHDAEMVLRKAPKESRRIFAEVASRIVGGQAESNYAGMEDQFPAFWLVMAFSHQAALDMFSSMSPRAIVWNELGTT